MKSYNVYIDNDSMLAVMPKIGAFTNAPIANVKYSIANNTLMDIDLPYTTIGSIFTSLSVIIDHHDNDVYLPYTYRIDHYLGECYINTENGCSDITLTFDIPCLNIGVVDILLSADSAREFYYILEGIITNSLSEPGELYL